MKRNFRRRILQPMLWLATTTCLTGTAAASPIVVTPVEPALFDTYGVATLAVLEHSPESLLVEAHASDGAVLGTFELTLSAVETAFRVHTPRTDWALEIDTTAPTQTLAGDAYAGSAIIRSSRDGVLTSEVLAAGTVVGGQLVDVTLTDLATADTRDTAPKKKKGKGNGKQHDDTTAGGAACELERFGAGLDPYDQGFFTAVITDKSLTPYRPVFFQPDAAPAGSLAVDAGATIGGGSTTEGCTVRDQQECAAVCAMAVVCGAAGCGGGVGCFGCLLAAYQCGYCLGKIAQGCPIQMY